MPATAMAALLTRVPKAVPAKARDDVVDAEFKEV